MTEELWTAVDRYFGDLLVPADPALDWMTGSKCGWGWRWICCQR